MNNVKGKGNKVIPMPQKHEKTSSGTGVIPMAHTEQAVAIELGKIHADYSWNARAERNVQDMADTESAGFEGFGQNIRDSGQITPVILRNTGGKTLAGGKTDKPFELVCGFRRFRAITMLNENKNEVDKAKKENRTNVPNLPNGTILATVKDVGDVVHARIMNGVENTARKNLKAQDLTFLVSDLAKAGMAQVPIAQSLAISQGWVSRLLKVAALPPAILHHWRTSTPIPPVTTKDGVYGLTAEQCKEVKRELSEPEMRNLSELKGSPEDITARYIRMVRPEVQGEGDGTPETNRDKVKEEIEKIAALMGCMVRAGVLDNGSLDWNRVIGSGKKGFPLDCGKDDSQDRLLELGDAAREAFEREVSKNVAKGADARLNVKAPPASA